MWYTTRSPWGGGGTARSYVRRSQEIAKQQFLSGRVLIAPSFARAVSGLHSEQNITDRAVQPTSSLKRKKGLRQVGDISTWGDSQPQTRAGSMQAAPPRDPASSAWCQIFLLTSILLGGGAQPDVPPQIWKSSSIARCAVASSPKLQIHDVGIPVSLTFRAIRTRLKVCDPHLAWHLNKRRCLKLGASRVHHRATGCI